MNAQVPRPSALSLEQDEQLREWVATGEPTSVILERIRIQNALRQPPAPWPDGISPGQIEFLRTESRVAVLKLRAQTGALVYGLGDRIQLATRQARNVATIETFLDLCDRALVEHLRRGAFDPPAEPADVVLAAEVGSRAATSPDERVGETLFRRAMALARLRLGFSAQHAKQVELLARITAAWDSGQTIDLPAQLEQVKDVLRVIRRQAMGQGLVAADSALAREPDESEDDDEEDYPLSRRQTRGA